MVAGRAVRLGYAGLDSFLDSVVDRRRRSQPADRGLHVAYRGGRSVVSRTICVLYDTIIAFIIRCVDGGLLLFLATVAASGIGYTSFKIGSARNFRHFANNLGVDCFVFGSAGADSQQFLRPKKLKNGTTF